MLLPRSSRHAGGSALLAGNVWFAAASGAGGNPGTITSPWDLQTALNGGSSGQIKPGDTVYIRRGGYTGRFTTNVGGAVGRNIEFRPYPADGRWWEYPVKIDNGGGTLTTTIQVQTDYLTFRGLEVFCSVGKRKSAQDGSSPTDLNSGSGFGSTSGGSTFKGVQLLNNCVHDTTDGIGMFTEDADLDVRENHIFNCGWDGLSDRGHGHSVYMQNDAIANPNSFRGIYKNVMVNCFADELNCFAQGSRVDNMRIDRNIAYSPAGASNLTSGSRTFLYQGGPLSTSPNMNGYVRGNVFYIPDFMTAVSTPNYFKAVAVDGDCPFGNLEITNNRFLAFACSNGAVFNGVFNGPNTISGNVFLQSIATDNATITQANFPSNSYITSKPVSNEIIQFQSDLEPTKGYLAILNWQGLTSVSVDISATVRLGHAWAIRDASNFFGAPVASGSVYLGGTVSVPMTGLTCAAPLGTAVPKTPATTAPEFGAFIVIETN